MEVASTSIDTAKLSYFVFSGGGIRGVAYASALHELQLLLRFDFRKLRGCAGTSIGALYAAALVAGLSIQAILEIAKRVSLIDLVNPEVTNLFSSYGFDNGDSLVRWVDSHLGDTMVTFSQLYSKTGKLLKIFATNLNTTESVVFSHDTTPDMPVAKAVFTSMCLPPLFAPVKMGDHFYCDGGLLNNFPLDCFDEPERTLGFRVVWGYCGSIESLEKYMQRLTYVSLVSVERRAFTNMPEHFQRQTISIDCGDVSTLGWRVSSVANDAMEACGRRAVRDFVLQQNLRALPLFEKRDMGVQTE